MNKDNLEIWDNIFQNNEWGKYPPVAVIKFIAKNFYNEPNRKEIKILEIGSGTGANLWFCAREGFSVYGIDGSKTAVNRMINRFEKEDLMDNLIGADIGDYYDKIDLIEDESFDAIIDVEGLSYSNFDISQKMIKKCFQKLKKNGSFFSLTFADGTHGLIGEECDYHVLMPKEGKLSNLGLTRYTTREDIDTLYKLDNNKFIRIERQELHLNDNNVIKEWIIEMKKVSNDY